MAVLDAASGRQRAKLQVCDLEGCGCSRRIWSRAVCCRKLDVVARVS